MFYKNKKQIQKISIYGAIAIIFFALSMFVDAKLAFGAQEYSFILSFSDGRSATLNLPFDEIGSITNIDLGGDGTDEILIGSPAGFKGEVYIARQDGSIVNSYLAYDEKFQGGVNVASGDLDGNGDDEIITIPQSGGSPHVRIFNGFGNPKINPGFFAEKENWRGKVGIAVKKFSQNQPVMITALLESDQSNIFKVFSNNGSIIKSYTVEKTKTEVKEENKISIVIEKDGVENILEIPKKIKSINENEKTIIIDLSEQKLSYYELGFRIKSFIVSTGASGYKTPVGTFSIINKTGLAYSKTYGLYMPYWMAFTNKGHGIHELPYWPSGYREGENHLGTPVSHGCVRLGIGNAKELYDWSKIGTKVIVQE